MPTCSWYPRLAVLRHKKPRSTIDPGIPHNISHHKWSGCDKTGRYSKKKTFNKTFEGNKHKKNETGPGQLIAHKIVVYKKGDLRTK